ncbi:MAG: DUF3261 domain-containing protein [Desulfosarcina sp.]|nr:DUF3261 domain-containing protein [Desulfobacterales bacterium]
MIMHRLLPLVALVLLSACQSLPVIVPAPFENAVADHSDPGPFVRHPWQMVHSIESRWPDGGRGFMLGVLTVEPQTDTIACAVLSLEGLLLFQARYENGRLEVTRALPPFHHPQMAGRMLEDIRLIFLAPPHEAVLQGLGPDNRWTRRHVSSLGTIDVTGPNDDIYDIRRYDAHHRLMRQITISACRAPAHPLAEPVPCRIDLEASGPEAYRLHMVLTEAEPLAVDKSAP